MTTTRTSVLGTFDENENEYENEDEKEKKQLTASKAFNLPLVARDAGGIKP